MKREEKNNNTNIYQNALTNNESLDMITLNWKPWPVTPEHINRLTEEVLQWATDEKIEALRITDFCTYKGTYTAHMYRLLEKYPSFKEAWKEATKIIGSRRERGALKKQYDGNTMRWGQHHYGEEWASYDKYHADLKNQEATKDTEIKLIIKETKESDRVKEKLEKIAAKRGKKQE